MGKEIASHGPFTITVEFNLTDGEQVAKASFDCAPGEVPTAKQIATAAENVKRQVQAQVGDQFRWQSRHEFVGDLLTERAHGVRFSVPGPDKFEAEWASQQSLNSGDDA